MSDWKLHNDGSVHRIYWDSHSVNFYAAPVASHPATLVAGTLYDQGNPEWLADTTFGYDGRLFASVREEEEN